MIPSLRNRDISLISAIYYFFLLTHSSHLTALPIPSICLFYSNFIFIKYKFDHVIPWFINTNQPKPTNQITKTFVKFMQIILYINLYYTWTSLYAILYYTHTQVIIYVHILHKLCIRIHKELTHKLFGMPYWIFYNLLTIYREHEKQ